MLYWELSEQVFAACLLPSPTCFNLSVWNDICKREGYKNSGTIAMFLSDFGGNIALHAQVFKGCCV